MLGVHVEAGPSTMEIIAAFERCEGWSRDDRKRFTYLAIFTGYIEGRKYLTPTRNISGCYTINGFAQTLQGRKGRRQFKEAILSQTRVINFVQKDIDQMFPKWEFDIEDTPAENIIKLIFPAVVSPAKKKASEEVAAEASEELWRRSITTKRKGTSSQNTTSPPKPTLEPGSESVNGTNAGRKSLAEDKGPDVPADASSSKDKAPESSLEDAGYQEKRDAALALCRAKSDRIRKLAGSQQSLYTANSTARVIIPNKKIYPGYNPFAPIDKKKLKELADWLKTYPTPLDKKPHDLPIIRLHIDAWINVLRKRYDANPQNFRSERMCFLVHLFAQQWRFNFKDFKDSEPDQNVLGRRLPGGAFGGRILMISIAMMNSADTHWIAMWISIPKRHIVVFDSICSSISPEELDVVMEPFLYMVPYLLVECAYSDEQRVQYNLEPFTYERPANIPPARAGDCGVYTLKRLTVKLSGMLDGLTISSLEILLSSDLL
uniref:Ubiquitin-like protease family profile domain-containing protein n=1 Tax=Brassica oleracea TaxID=3712 RepID=A0A3P6EA52_BRAOL|nr:unnamed protein product [Brassica oleracea]